MSKSITLPAPEGFEFDGPPRMIHPVEWYAFLTDGELRAESWAGAVPSYRKHIPLRKVPAPIPNASCTVTVEDVYGSVPKLPKEHEYLGFGVAPPAESTHWMTNWFGMSTLDLYPRNIGPRIFTRLVGGEK